MKGEVGITPKGVVSSKADLSYSKSAIPESDPGTFKIISQGTKLNRVKLCREAKEITAERGTSIPTLLGCPLSI